MKVEILYFDGCPHWQAAEQLVRETLSELGTKADIELINVKDNNDAAARRFLGSPSIRVNGRDIEVADETGFDYTMRCRVYRTPEGQSGLPPKDKLVAALKG